MKSLLVRHPLIRLQGLFVSSTVSKGFIMAGDKHFKKCVNTCPRFLTIDNTHDLCIICLGKKHALSVLEGAVCVHCERFLMKKLRSHVSLFLRKERQASVPCGLDPALTEANRRLRLWGSQMELSYKLCFLLHLLLQQSVLCCRQASMIRRWRMRVKKLRRLSPLSLREDPKTGPEARSEGIDPV